MTCIYFSCHKEGHTIHDCFLVFPHKKKRNFKRIDAMLATSNHVERKNDEKKFTQPCPNYGNRGELTRDRC
jgi:hypothetical protein